MTPTTGARTTLAAVLATTLAALAGCGARTELAVDPAPALVASTPSEGTIAPDADGVRVVEDVLAELGFEGREAGDGIVFEPRAGREEPGVREAGLPFLLVEVGPQADVDRDRLLAHLDDQVDRIERVGWPGDLTAVVTDRSPSYLQYLLVAPDGRYLNLTAERPDTIRLLPDAVRRIADGWARG